MENLFLDLLDEKTGTYFDSCINEYILILNGFVVGGYKPTGNKDLDREIDCMMWRKCLFTPNTDFNLTPPTESQVKS